MSLTPLPQSLGSALRPYVRLCALLDAPSYSPAQLLDRLGRVSPPLVPLNPPPDAAALVADLLRLRLLEPLPAGRLRRWPFLAGALEAHLMRYVALTLLAPAPLQPSSLALPALEAPWDGLPYPAHAWPPYPGLLAWYLEAGLIGQAEDSASYQALPDALAPLESTSACARVLNAFLDQLQAARAEQAAPPLPVAAPLPPLAPELLDERIALIQRELLVERSTLLRIYRALVAGQHVMLCGPPGTGKTHLARLLPRVFWRATEPYLQTVLATDPQLAPDTPPQQVPHFAEGYHVEVVTATEDWAVRHVIGGIAPVLLRHAAHTTLAYELRHGCLTRALLSNYAHYDGRSIPHVFQRQMLHVAQTRYRGRWLVIDEFTRAPIDAAFGSLLTTLGGQGIPLAVPTESGELPVPMPQDFRIIGTLNSFDRHFLNQISEAMKRRFTFIDLLPPGPALAAAEQGIALFTALRRLTQQGLLPPDAADQPDTLVWPAVLTITRSYAAARSAPSYQMVWHDEFASAAFTSLWSLFSAIRNYRQLGTAQLEALCTALFSGQLVGMSWPEALDSALADTLADQLQVLNRDEQRVLLAYLAHAANPESFSQMLRTILETLPLKRQAAHLELLDLPNANALAPADLDRCFALGEPLGLSAHGIFARRLRAFVSEHGL